MSDKRDRAVNFTTNEIRILVDLIVKYSHILENKKTDSVMWKKKEETWEKLCTEFNGLSGLCYRTTKNLKIKYEGLKRSLKKKKAANKTEIYKTGGGPVETTPYTDFEEKLLSILLLSIEGLSPFDDSDGAILNTQPEAYESTSSIIIQADGMHTSANDLVVLEDITLTTENQGKCKYEKSIILTPK